MLDSIRHMIFTGNPGVGKTTISRLVAKLYKQLGVSRLSRWKAVALGLRPIGPEAVTSPATARLGWSAFCTVSCPGARGWEAGGRRQGAGRPGAVLGAWANS